MKDSRLGRYFYGTGHEVHLPSTRRESFKYYGKEHFWKLIALNVVCCVLTVPSVVWLYSMNYQLSERLEAIAAEDYTAYASAVLGFSLKTYSVLIPLLCILFTGLAGVFRMVKRMAFDERCTFADFFKGIKEDGLRFFVYGILFGLSLFFLCFDVTYYDFSLLHPVYKGILTGLCVCWFILVVVFGMFYCTGTVVYSYTFRQLIKNSFMLTFAGFVKNLLFAVLCLGVFVAVPFIPSPFQLIAIGLVGVLYPAFAVLALTCWCNNVYDIHINPKLGKEYVGRGLRRDDGENDV